MSCTETVKTLSGGKQRKSLGEASKKEKALKKPTRTTVINPSEIDWLDLDQVASNEMVTLVEKSIKCLKMTSRHVPLNEIRPVPTSERSEFRKKWVSETAVKNGFDISKYTLLRSTISLGVNCVSKALEVDQLAGVIIEKDVDPQIITKLLIPIANSKGVPIISLSGLNSSFKKTTGMRCIALGFKKSCECVTNEFYNLLQAIKQRSAELRGNEPDVECSRVQENPAQQSFSLLSSEEERHEGHPQQSPAPVSIEKEIARLTSNMDAIRRSMPKIHKSDYIPPKIRRVTPK